MYNGPLISVDFPQTLSVIPKSTPADEINACLKSSIIWPKVEKISLPTNMRAQISRDEKAHMFAEKLL